MASPFKTKEGSWRIIVTVNGVRDSATRPTKREAQEWAGQREAEMRAIASGRISEYVTTHQAISRYLDEETPKHRGASREHDRVQAIKAQFPDIPLAKVGPHHIIAWRDARLSQVKPSTALRELKIVNLIFKRCCSLEWRYLATNPCDGVDRPRGSASRTRTIKYTETRAMLRQFGYPKRDTSVHAVGWLFLLALCTGMRQGEILGIEWPQVYPKHIHLPKTKNSEPRDVPLSLAARRIVERMRGYHPESVFNLTTAKVAQEFAKARRTAGLSGFTFHDARHTAATRIGMSGKLTLQQMCAVFGWKDPKMAMVYFNPKASDIANLL
jgi:integrase